MHFNNSLETIPLYQIPGRIDLEVMKLRWSLGSSLAERISFPEQQSFNYSSELDILNRRWQEWKRVKPPETSDYIKDDNSSFILDEKAYDAKIEECKRVLELVKVVDIQHWDELRKHVVLVHGISRNALTGIIDDSGAADFNFDKSSDSNYVYQYLLQKVLTPEGVIGSHLNFSIKKFNGPLISRPHLHWAWSQLVQPNGGGGENGWEDCEILILEPLEAFDDSSIYGIAPYDTLTIGEHHLSEVSTILLPKYLEEQTRQYFLDKYKGTILYYDNNEKLTPRERVFNVLKSYYLGAGHLVNPKTGAAIAPVNQSGQPGYDSVGGYFEETWFELPNGRRTRLITRSGNERLDRQGRIHAIHSTALKEAIIKGKFLGLHIDSPTFMLENQKNKSFESLNEFLKEPSSVVGKSCFVGYAKDIHINKLVILEAYKFWITSVNLNEKSRIQEVEDYILHTAIYADIMSLCFASEPERAQSSHAGNLPFFPQELELMICKNRDDLIESIANLHVHKSSAAFEKYATTLIKHIHAIVKARFFTSVSPRLIYSDYVPIETNFCVIKAHEFGEKAIDEWKMIENPRSISKFHARLPISSQERNFFNKLEEVFKDYSIVYLHTLFENLYNAQILKSSFYLYIKWGIIQYLKKYYYIELLNNDSPVHIQYAEVNLYKVVRSIPAFSRIRRNPVRKVRNWIDHLVKIKVRIWCKKVMTALSDRKISAKELISKLSEISEFKLLSYPRLINWINNHSEITKLKVYYEKSAGVSEGYTVGEHTERVIDLAQKYRNQFEPVVSKVVIWGDFLLFLALHDIGKGVSKEAVCKASHPNMPPKELELLMSRKILTDTFQQLSMRSRSCHIFQAMLMYDSQGDYLQGDINEECFKEQLLEMAAVSGLGVRQFYELYCTFHLIDAASYPTLCKHGFFTHGEETLQHCDPYREQIDTIVKSFKQ